MQSHNLEVTRTARYFTIGSYSQYTQEVWFLLHGYAQLAADFITLFTDLQSTNRFIVAPEGLNRFYAKGFGGKPAANWMTSESRETEIEDYIKYLNLLYVSLLGHHHTCKIVVLGFSQGVATASRWVHHSDFRFNRFIICSGEVAHEIQTPFSDKIKALELFYISAYHDPLIDSEKHRTYLQLLQKQDARILQFEGKHEIHFPSLLKTTQIPFAE
jgi:predicted esterase